MYISYFFYLEESSLWLLHLGLWESVLFLCSAEMQGSIISYASEPKGPDRAIAHLVYLNWTVFYVKFFFLGIWPWHTIFGALFYLGSLDAVCCK